ncbi:uncharacterized protein MYCGRDRAFT_88949 [Zymoseptoria tritici IPO323]|uniref:Uncharacterized protein n=1 Tax=Zymoseptoria tritici (strain CBS 115943 / IPO323) TaxID=336722 RepID=F9WYW1_ZYMTI|nr:uncharacterized protein MYCGRDRAFT_88949 [Zymoseptoria tritici IPO323]EGP92604.1 hypothetical protein MYCGRDRAFT_88949 [Zymoseptoria tritici IPO323]
MANKEDNKSTSPIIASGSRVWQPSSSNSPSPGLLTPSSKPALRQQRDHSACRIQNSPLKVRKTRENLKQASLYADIPPPCVHGFHANGSDCHVQPGDSAAAFSRPDPRFARAQDGYSDASGSTLVGEASQVQVPRPLTPMGPSQTGKLLRHRSISRRVLTRVKEGISQRSRSSHTKTQDPDASLVRRFSGRRKESLEEQSRSRSFEVSRDSFDVQAYARNPELEMSTPGRSFTDCSVSTDDSNRSGFLHTPPQVRCTPPAHTRQYSGRLLTPEPGTYSPSAEPTPRASARDIPSSLEREGIVLVTVPFVDLSISPDRESVDVGRSRDIWVAVEGTVRTRVVESNSMQPQEAQLRKSSMDAIIIIDQEVLQSAPKSTHKIIVELCSRLNIAGDRLAVLCAKVEHVDTGTTKCDCDELHALWTPSLSRLFERLSIAPSTVDTIFEEEWESLADSLQALSTRGLRKDLVQTFVISKTPTAILQLVDRLVPWPVHTFKIGLSSERSEFPSATIKLHNWAVEIHDDQEDIVDLLDNMIRDLRHGCSMGAVPSLRLCYKPLQGTSIIEVLGQKALKNVQLGQRCTMFLKVRIPRIDTSRASLPKDDIDQDSLFAELESIVGTLETEYLHVEARYRNTVLPSDNVQITHQLVRCG